MSETPTIIAITKDDLEIENLIQLITTPDTGAACTFTGMVRGETQKEGLPEHTQYLDYEAYISMAESKMTQVADEIRTKWPTIVGIAIVQRIGQIFPGTPAVVISCTSPHRDTGVFEASRYGIDRLKEIVPIWKKEVSTDGSEWIEGHYTPKPHE